MSWILENFHTSFSSHSYQTRRFLNKTPAIFRILKKKTFMSVFRLTVTKLDEMYTKLRGVRILNRSKETLAKINVSVFHLNHYDVSLI